MVHFPQKNNCSFFSCKKRPNLGGRGCPRGVWQKTTLFPVSFLEPFPSYSWTRLFSIWNRHDLITSMFVYSWNPGITLTNLMTLMDMITILICAVFAQPRRAICGSPKSSSNSCRTWPPIQQRWSSSHWSTWSLIMALQYWNIVSKNLQVNIGQRRRRMNLVKVSPSVLPTVFRQLEIYPDICTNMKIQRPSSGLLTNSHPPLVPSRTLNAMLHLKFGCSYRFWGNNPIISCRFSERFPRTLTSGIQH